MAGKDVNEKQLKEMQAAHVKFRQEVGAKIVTASKIKEYCKALGHHCSSGLEEEVADLVYKALWRSILRCDGNNRMTIMKVDL
jgi:hypothetical protein